MQQWKCKIQSDIRCKHKCSYKQFKKYQHLAEIKRNWHSSVF